MGDASGNVFPEQTLVEIDRRREFQCNVSKWFGEPATPECLMSHGDCRFAICDCRLKRVSSGLLIGDWLNGDATTK
jgi:hypothetical protein